MSQSKPLQDPQLQAAYAAVEALLQKYLPGIDVKFGTVQSKKSPNTALRFNRNGWSSDNAGDDSAAQAAANKVASAAYKANVEVSDTASVDAGGYYVAYRPKSPHMKAAVDKQQDVVLDAAEAFVMSQMMNPSDKREVQAAFFELENQIKRVRVASKAR